MSVRSGHKINREPLEIYNGYRIIMVTEIEYERSLFNPSRYSKWPKSKEVHFDFCAVGFEKNPSHHYCVWASNIKECKECIDNFIKDDAIYFTAEERQKYVKIPNSKCGYDYGYDSLMKLLKEHKKTDNCIKGPKKLEGDLAKLIADYFVKQGVENVSVDIRLNEQYLVNSIDGAFTIRCGTYC